MMIRLPTSTMSIMASTVSTRSASCMSSRPWKTSKAAWKNLMPNAISASDRPRNNGAMIQRAANRDFSKISSVFDVTGTLRVWTRRAYCSQTMRVGRLQSPGGSMITRRDLVAALVAAGITLACVTTAQEPGKLLDSTAWLWADLQPKKTDVGELRTVVRQPTRTLDELEMHITTLKDRKSVV